MWLGNLTRVTNIFFGNNNFTSQIPSSFSNLNNLTFLHLKYNYIGGKIPSFFTNLTKPTAIHLSYSQLTGQFAEFQFSNSLEYISIDNNKLYDMSNLHFTLYYFYIKRIRSPKIKKIDNVNSETWLPYFMGREFLKRFLMLV